MPRPGQLCFPTSEWGESSSRNISERQIYQAAFLVNPVHDPCSCGGNSQKLADIKFLTIFAASYSLHENQLKWQLLKYEGF